jgi:four helix bundle protein
MVDGGRWMVKTAVSLQSYRELEVWQLGMDLVVQCYQVTRSFPKDELFGLTFQIRRAAVSVPANIAEGQGRHHTRDFLHHLSIAKGSLTELETHLMVSERVGILDKSSLQPLLEIT